jgi:hypothetical protein
MTHIHDPSEQSSIQNRYTDTLATLPIQHSDSAVSWGAIFAGAAAAAALAMILLMLGTGLGLSFVSPWGNHGLSAETIGVATIAWLMFTQIAASGMGGYLAGRLRTKWVKTHSHEIYFRDTAHGFLAWAMASLLSAVLLTPTIGAIVGGSTKVVASLAGSAASTSIKGILAGPNDTSTISGSPMGYFVNSLFRISSNSSVSGKYPSSGAIATDATVSHKSMSQNDAVSPAQQAEVAGIFTTSISSGSLAPDDLHYVAQLVSQHTGASQNEAEQRVHNIYEKVQMKLNDAKIAAEKAADTTRKTASHVTLWAFIALLTGAFVASLSATFGGRQRDL